MRYSWVVGALIPLCMPVAAKADIYGFKIQLGIDGSGTFQPTDFSSLSSDQFTDAEIAGCAAFGVSCTTEDIAMDMPRFKSVRSEDVRSGESYRGLYRSPQGFEICKAKIDLDHAILGNGTTISATMARDRKDNGLAYSVTIKKGTEIKADLYVEFVPENTADQFECFAKNTIVWKCSDKTCPDKGAFDPAKGLYPPARFP